MGTKQNETLGFKHILLNLLTYNDPYIFYIYIFRIIYFPYIYIIRLWTTII